MKKALSHTLKYLTVFSSLGGVALSLVRAQKDGYSHFLKRLLYFTAQSNIWIGLTVLAILFLPLTKAEKREKRAERLYLLRYVFTVSITITGLIFCGLLAPFSDGSYRPWTVSNVLTHVCAPVFAVADYFLDGGRRPARDRRVFLCVLPPFFYFLFTGVLEFFGVDFGRGVAYPYFFFNFRSPVGLFGVSPTGPYPFYLGAFYWLILFMLIVLGFGFLYAKKTTRRAPKKA